MLSPRSITTTGPGDWRVIRRLLPYLWRYRWRIALALVLLTAARAANVAVPLTLKKIVDHFDGEVPLLLATSLALLAGYGVLRFSAVLFNELRNLVFSKAGIDIVRHIAQRIFAHLHTLSLDFHLDRKTGGLSRDIDRGNMAITNFLRIIVFNIAPVVIELMMVMVILWRQLDMRFVFITLVMVAVYLTFTVLVTRWRTRFRVQMNHAESAANTQLLESLINYETVKVFGNERLEENRYDASLKHWAAASQQSTRSLVGLNIGQGFIVAVGMTALLLLAAAGVAEQRLSVGDFVMLNAFLIQLYIPLSFIGSVYRDINHALVDMEKLFALLAQVPSQTESPTARALTLRGGRVCFEHVVFGYHAERPILNDISFEIAAGRVTAVVGASGAGKSTLARLLLRLYDPQSGRITIDGQALRTLTWQSLRAVLGVVPQDCVLFNDTLRYNITYGRPAADTAAMVAAARVAQIDDFIRSQPAGYDSLVGERGLKLSGGEKQRVAIARVVLKGARILVFDEATSALDSRSEQAIQRTLTDITANTTTLIIAHRLSTITAADEILVLDGGKITERGSHSSLLKRDGLYAQMWQQQYRV